VSPEEWEALPMDPDPKADLGDEPPGRDVIPAGNPGVDQPLVPPAEGGAGRADGLIGAGGGAG